MLIENFKADLNLKNKEGYSPLHISLRHKHESIAHYLLDRGANAELDTSIHPV
jgi:ankyrin repeat protein